jgi:hypothetical protein
MWRITMLKDDLIHAITFYESYEEKADRIISLLDKKVQEAGWHFSPEDIRGHVAGIFMDRPATFEEWLAGQAVKR